jgi:EAL domain-containing protein (putative c-di-GMP-specific phosphodiesterase class I)/CHASE2 domain-containing sensor protein
MGRLANWLDWRATPLAAAAAAGLLLGASGLGVAVDRGFAELRDSIRTKPASGEIHIVEIDGRSIDAIRRWPWPRSLHGAVVDRLREAQARTIAFDIDFSSESVAAEDAAFAAALARAGGGVVLPTFSQSAGHGRNETIDSAPIPALADNAFLATANVAVDTDGALRSMPFGASMLAERTDSAGDSFGIDFAIDPASIPRSSFVDVLRGRVPASALAGKRVLIGSTAVENGDHYAAPGHGMLPGVVIQALAAETLIAGSERHPGGSWLPLAFALLLVAASAARGPRPGRIAAVGAGAILLLPASFAADATLATSFEIVPALAALGAAALLSAAALRRRRERERSRRDQATGLPNLAALEADAGRDGWAEIVVARIAGHAGLTAALGPAAMAEIVVALAERLRLGSGASVIYRCDEASLGWISPGDAASSLDGIAALARDQIVAARRVEVPLHFGLSAGPGAMAGQLAANAALAASHAERSGARWQLFTERDSVEVARNLALMGDLDAAFLSGAICNHYQPKLDIGAGEIRSVEALVRWFHPQRGLLSPDQFVPLIEENGRARDLTVHVLREAIAQAVRWRDEAALELGVAVNMSAGLLAEADFMAELRRMVADSSLAPRQLTIEVTETAAMADPDAAIAALEAWRSLGVGVSIDDFGTGQSSLGYIRMLPATELKIDRSFVSDLGRTPRNAIMVRSTVALAHELGISVVAEGVEEEGCLAALAAMGCDVAQGYLIGRPVPGEEIVKLVRSRADAPLPRAAQA